MLFTSIIFLFFFLPAVLFGYYVVFKDKREAQTAFLFIASLFFYAWGEPWFVAVMLLSVACNWYFGKAASKARGDQRRGRWVLGCMLAFNISILFVFKYLVFAITNLNALLHVNLPVPEIILPIGISFFTFQSISYVIDIHRGTVNAQESPLKVGFYIAFFPQLMAGPIVRYLTIADQIDHRKESPQLFSEGVRRFLYGLAKKVLLANPMAEIVDSVFALPASEISPALAWLGSLAYGFQIFFDFSGYSDMAIGLARMFGFRFEENFNYPFIARSVSDFWRRWHISLGAWFRDYLYFPLGGSRVKSKTRLIFNLFVVWALTGIWHGANWTYLTWGLYCFVFLTFEKLSGFEKRRLGLLKYLYIHLFLLIGWVIVRSDNMPYAIEYLGRMFSPVSGGWLDVNARMYFEEYKYVFLLAALFSTPLLSNLKDKAKGSLLSPRAVYVSGAVILPLLFFVTLTYIIKGAYNPFIYFKF